jgi:hypothetical protein
MANPAYVQSKSQLGAAAIAFTSSNTAGNFLVAYVRTDGTVPTCSDSANGSYSVALNNVAGTLTFFSVFYFPNCAAGANTVTVTGGVHVSSVVIVEYSGVALTSPVDGTPVVIGSSSSSTMTTLTANDLIIGLADGLGVSAAGAGYTLRESAATYALEDNTGPPFVANAAGSNTASFSITVGGATGIVAFKGAPATHSISGNAGVAGATVNVTGTSAGSATADGSGNYSVSGLVDGSYTVTPVLARYKFTPASRNKTISGGDVTGVNFTAKLSYSNHRSK